MATVQLTSPAKGKMPGDTVTTTDSEARWLTANGYARVDDDGDHRLDSSVEASADPTLAANREAPGEPPSTVFGEDTEDWSAQVADRFEFKGKAGRGKRKIIPGKPETLVAAAEAVAADEDGDEDSTTVDTSEEEQPAPSEVATTVDPLAGEDLTERPDIKADDSPVKETAKRRR